MITEERLEQLRGKYRKTLLPCEVCGGTDLAPFQSRGRIAGPGAYGDYPITICRTCGFKMANPRFEDAFYQEYYEELYRAVAFGATRPSDEYVAQQKDRGARVLAYARRFTTEAGRMLDHGCASGATMLPWLDAGWQARGIDPHRPSIQIGQEMFGLDLTVAAGEDLPFDDGSFDLVLSLGSLEHVADLAAAMEECRRVLVPGGLLLIRWRSNVIFGSPLEYFNHNHYRFFSRATWRLVLARYGFSVIDMTDERIEGWDSYDYIMARRDLDDGAARLRSLLAGGAGDDAAAEIAALRKCRVDYRDRCRRFLDLHAANSGAPDALMARVRAEIPGWGFLGGSPGDVVERSRMEAERYLRAFDAGEVV